MYCQAGTPQVKTCLSSARKYNAYAEDVCSNVPTSECHHRQPSMLLSEWAWSLHLVLYPCNSPSLLTHCIWFLLKTSLQSKCQISRSNYVGFSNILKKHQPMTCLTFLSHSTWKWLKQFNHRFLIFKCCIQHSTKLVLLWYSTHIHTSTFVKWE